MAQRLLFLKWIGLMVFLPLPFSAQEVPVTGVIHTADVNLTYWVYGKPTAKTPVIAVNGGPGLSHIYMIQNDVWNRCHGNGRSFSTINAAQESRRTCAQAPQWICRRRLPI